MGGWYVYQVITMIIAIFDIGPNMLQAIEAVAALLAVAVIVWGLFVSTKWP